MSPEPAETVKCHATNYRGAWCGLPESAGIHKPPPANPPPGPPNPPWHAFIPAPVVDDTGACPTCGGAGWIAEGHETFDDPRDPGWHKIDCPDCGAPHDTAPIGVKERLSQLRRAWHAILPTDDQDRYDYGVTLFDEIEAAVKAQVIEEVEGLRTAAQATMEYLDGKYDSDFTNFEERIVYRDELRTALAALRSHGGDSK